MAGITIVSNGNDLDVNFGDYGDGVKLPSDTNYKNGDIIKIQKFNDHIAVYMIGAQVWYLTHQETDNYFVVDLVNGTKPNDNGDLYSKIKALRI